MFPFNGSSFFRVPPFATPWLPSGPVRHVSNATMKALRLLPFLRARLLWRLAVAYCRRIVWFRSLAVRCSRFAPGRCSSGVVLTRLCFRQKTEDLPSSQGSLFMHLCRGLGPRWDGRRLGHLFTCVASRSVPAGSTAKTPHIGTFVAHSHGFGARCQRFVPASRPTTHDSLPAAWLHALSGQDSYLLGSFSEFLLSLRSIYMCLFPLCLCLSWRNDPFPPTSKFSILKLTPD